MRPEKAKVTQEITFITSHPQKAEELSWHLDHPISHQKLDLPEVQSLDPREVITAKAQEAYRQLQRPVLVEDFSLRFSALGKLPGPLVKWFMQELQPKGLCELLDGYSDRGATAQIFCGLYDGNQMRIFDGSREGSIAATPRGEVRFGVDNIFIPEGWDKTWGEMTKEEQIASSVRRIALRKLQAHLAEA